MTTALDWNPTPFARSLLVITGMAVAAALATDRPELVAMSAAPVAWFAVSAFGPAPAEASIEFAYPNRCFEAEPIPITVTVTCAGTVDLLRVTLTPGEGMIRVALPLQCTAADTATVELRTELVATRWGRHPIGHVTMECWTSRRLRRSITVQRSLAELAAYPSPAAVRRLPVTSMRHDHTGDHPAEMAGGGIEFHSVRPFTAGDGPRRVNWPVSTRRGALYVTTARAERAVDIVLAVDVLTDAGLAGHSSRDLALRGATGMAQAVLRAHDRVGLVAVGGRLQWLKPDLAERQFYRITEAILDVVDWESYLDPDVDAVPYTALPAGARVVYFSPLLDERGVAAAQALRSRGHPVTIVDVCTSQLSSATIVAELARRVWLLERTATCNRLGAVGIKVSSWDGEAALDRSSPHCCVQTWRSQGDRGSGRGRRGQTTTERRRGPQWWSARTGVRRGRCRPTGRDNDPAAVGCGTNPGSYGPRGPGRRRRRSRVVAGVARGADARGFPWRQRDRLQPSVAWRVAARDCAAPCARRCGRGRRRPHPRLRGAGVARHHRRVDGPRLGGRHGRGTPGRSTPRRRLTAPRPALSPRSARDGAWRISRQRQGGHALACPRHRDDA